jgi:peptidoglycan/xylan/chitin deacetylase (PgdA/CDA1 family)
LSDQDLGTHLDFLRSTPSYGIACFSLALDLEFAWSIARRGGKSTSRSDEVERSRRARNNLPAMLDLCDLYGVPMTVATVAHLALERCDHPEPPLFAPSWVGGDWYAVDPRSSTAAAPDYYAPDVVRSLTKRTASHELASHGFTHVDLGDSETPEEVAVFELVESYRILRRIDPHLRSFVFPKNHVAYLGEVGRAGYRIYRAARDVRIERDEFGLWPFPRGLWLAPGVVAPRDVLRVVDEAAGLGQVTSWFFHLHEFATPRQLERFFHPVFSHLRELADRDRISLLTMGGIVDALVG